MARLLTVGFELGSILAEPGGASVENGTCTDPVFQSGTPTLSTTTVRTGTYALRIQGGQQLRFGGLGSSNGVSYYHRAYVRFAAWPTATRNVMSRPSGYSVEITSTGNLRLYHGANLIGSGTNLSLDTWYRIEFMQNINTAGGSDDSGELRVNGTTIASETNVARTTTASANFDFGSSVADASLDMFIDDVAVNTSGGASQNSWPDQGEIKLLKPVADSAVGSGWEAPQTSGSDTTDIYTAVDNIPPAGVGHSDVDANNTAYIFHATNNQNNYEANMQSYDSAGVTGTITVVQGFVRTGSNSTTNRAGALDLISNPDVGAEQSFTWDAANVTANTEPTGWWNHKQIPAYDPSVTTSTQPVLIVGKRVSNAQVCMVDFMGVYVESVGTVTVQGAATLTGTGSETISGRQNSSGASTLTGTGSQTVNGYQTSSSASTLSGTGTLTARAGSGILNRVFDGNNDELRVSVGSADLTGAFTIAALYRWSGTAGGIVNHFDSFPSHTVGLGVNVGGQLFVAVGITIRTVSGIELEQNEWCFVAATKASGAATPRLHIWTPSGGWEHNDAGATLNDASSSAGGSIRFGSYIIDGFVTASELAVVGEWDSVLSDANIETFDNNSATQDFYDLDPVALWNWNQDDVTDPVIDLTGNGADEISRTETFVRWDGPEDWNYTIESIVTGSATLSGTGSQTISGRQDSTGAATLSGTGSETISGTRIVFSSSTLSGTGSETIAGTHIAIAQSALTGLGSSTISGEHIAIASSTLSGTGSQSISGQLHVFAESTLSGIGSQTISGLQIVTSEADLSGQGTQTISSFNTISNAASLSGIGSQTINSTHNAIGASTLSGVGSLTADGEVEGAVVGAAILTGAGSESISGLQISIGSATLSGTGSQTATGTHTAIGESTLSGSGTQTINGTNTAIASATLSGVGSETVAGEIEVIASASLSGVGSETVSGRQNSSGASTLSGIGTLTAEGDVEGQLLGEANLSGQGSETISGEHIAYGSATLSGTGSQTIAGYQEVEAAATLSGNGTLTADGEVEGVVTGEAILTGTGQLAANGTQSVSASSTLSGVGTQTISGTNTAIASATLQGQSSETIAGDYIVIGIALLSGTSTQSIAGNQISSGIASLSGQSSQSVSGLQSSSGVALLSGISSQSIVGVVEKYGEAMLSGTSSQSISATHLAIGLATLSGVGSVLANGYCDKSGTAILSGSGSSTIASFLQIYSQAELLGIGSLIANGFELSSLPIWKNTRYNTLSAGKTPDTDSGQPRVRDKSIGAASVDNNGNKRSVSTKTKLSR